MTEHPVEMEPTVPPLELDLSPVANVLILLAEGQELLLRLAMGVEPLQVEKGVIQDVPWQGVPCKWDRVTLAEMNMHLARLRALQGK